MLAEIENLEIRAVDAFGPEASALIARLDLELKADTPASKINGLKQTDKSGQNLIFLCAFLAGETVACGALRLLEPGLAEVKRMYVLPDYRGRGLAQAMLIALESLAIERGLGNLVLETGTGQKAAQALYRKCGWTDREPYGEFIGSPTSVCFERRLASSTS
jgi:putative acetyltransferase